MTAIVDRPNFERGLPKVSVTIPVYNDKVRMRHCLSALQRQSYDGDVEIIVIDNGSADNVLELAAEFSNVLFMSENRPGAYVARNTGLAKATGEVLAFTDSDCDPDPQWIAKAVDALFSGENIGFVGGHIKIATARRSPSVAELYDHVTAFPQEHYVKDLHFAATANMVTTRLVMDRVGLFDERLKSGGDREWGTRTGAFGYRAVFEPLSIVTHPARRMGEILQKVRRVAAGMSRAKPEPYYGLLQFFRAFVPPVREVGGLWGVRGADLTLGQKFRVFFFAWFVRCYRSGATIWYHVMDADAPRA